MSAITLAPILNLRSAAVQLAVSFGALAELGPLELDPSELPPEVGQEIGTDSWDYLCRELTWIAIPRDCSSPSGLKAVHSEVEVDDIATAIRLVTDTDICIPLVWTDWTGHRNRERWWQGGYSAVTNYPDRWMMARRRGLLDTPPIECEFGQRQWAKVQQVLDNLARVPPSARRLNLAMRRYISARDRINDEDAIIDLFVTLEALLISENFTTDIGALLEKKVRLGLTGTEWADDISEIAQHYWVRNQIVHGKVTEYDTLKTLSLLSRDTRRLLSVLMRDPERLELIANQGFSKN
jgi:hypothetical protein